MDEILKSFPIKTSEYMKLDEKFGDLCEYAAWQLFKKNSRNNHTDDQQDMSQELRWSLIIAGSYYKRQVYIEACLKLLQKYVTDPLNRAIVDQLIYFWENKTRHGANKQKYGVHQERIMEKMIRKYVPKQERPDKNAELKIDSKFTTYCKAITWNKQKAMGKKITREKSIRNGQVSLSEYDYLSVV